MQIDQDVKSELVTRLSRIEGQIRGIAHPKKSAAAGYSVTEVEKLFLKLS